VAAKERDERYKDPGLWGTLVAILLLRAYMVMLALGILHLQWTPSIPALGIWECLALSAAFTLAKR
jgi:hypothetical protein